jgi:hypothetical protein
MASYDFHCLGLLYYCTGFPAGLLTHLTPFIIIIIIIIIATTWHE